MKPAAEDVDNKCAQRALGVNASRFYQRHEHVYRVAFLHHTAGSVAFSRDKLPQSETGGARDKEDARPES